jgi:hypothetical protein
LVQNLKQEETRMLTELSDMELALVAGGQAVNPSGPPPGGGLASLGGDFSKLFIDLKDGASFSTIRSDFRAILHDAGVGGF